MKDKETKEELETVKCSICHQPFERDINREGGRLISCPAHSFGEVEPEDYEVSNKLPNKEECVHGHTEEEIRFYGCETISPKNC